MSIGKISRSTLCILFILKQKVTRTRRFLNKTNLKVNRIGTNTFTVIAFPSKTEGENFLVL